jgi:hypothetical protein
MPHACLDNLVRIRMGNILTFQCNLAMPGMDESGDGAKGSTFACSIGANQGYDFSFIHID